MAPKNLSFLIRNRLPASRQVLPIAACLVVAFAVTPANAQLFSRPQAPVQAQDDGGAETAQLLLRIDRLENQIRSMNGQIEQLQFSQRRMEDLLKKFQQDVDFRFQDSQGGRAPGGSAPPRQKRTDLETAPGDVITAAPVVIDPAGSASPNGRRRGDAFDPGQNPTAPGAPRSLGQINPDGSPASPRDSHAPLDLTASAARGPAAQSDALPGYGAPSTDPRGPGPTYQPPAQSSSLGARPIGVTPPPGSSPQPGPSAAPVSPAQGSNAGQRVTPGGTIIAGLPPAAGSKEEFDLALVTFNNGQFDAAETGFKGFLAQHPKDRLAPDATFYLGESYWKRGRAREAAEQYLKISTDYSKSARAPEALVRLGLALEKLGAKEQACATWSEVGRKYPSASATIRNGADREAKRLAC